MTWIVLLVLLIPLFAVISDSPLGRALARRLEGRAGNGRESAERIRALEAEVERLSRELDRLNGEVARLDEGTEFLERLLEDRPRAGRELGPGGRRD